MVEKTPPTIGMYTLTQIKAVLAPDMSKRWEGLLVVRNKAQTVYAIITQDTTVHWFLAQGDGFIPIPDDHEAVAEARAADKVSVSMWGERAWEVDSTPPDSLWKAWRDYVRKN